MPDVFRITSTADGCVNAKRSRGRFMSCCRKIETIVLGSRGYRSSPLFNTRCLNYPSRKVDACSSSPIYGDQVLNERFHVRLCSRIRICTEVSGCAAVGAGEIMAASLACIDLSPHQKNPG